MKCFNQVLNLFLHPPTQETTPACRNTFLPQAGTSACRHGLGRRGMRNSGWEPFQRWIYHASADFAHRRMTHRPARRTNSLAGESLGACAPKRYSAQGRRWVWFLGTTGLPVGLHNKASTDFKKNSISFKSHPDQRHKS